MDRAIVRLLHPAWTANPDAWVWSYNGRPQGIGLNWRQSPGKFNLMWLAMGMDKPPASYDIMQNGFLAKVILGLPHSTLDGVPLADSAEACTLRQWLRRLDSGVLAGPLAENKPLFQILGAERLKHAHA